MYLAIFLLPVLLSYGHYILADVRGTRSEASFDSDCY